jgi:trigger factor
MAVTAKETENKGLKRGYEVTVPADNIAKRKKTRLAEIATTITLKGFRKGKAPLNVVEAQYGDAVMGEILEAVVNAESQKVLNDNNVKPATQPKIEITSFEKDQDLTFKMEVEAMPDFDIMDIKRLKLTKPVADVDDSKLEEALKTIASQNSDSKAITTKRAAKNDDIVVIDFDGSVDGEKKDGMAGEKFNLELGGGQFIPGFEEQLVGKKAGDDVTVTVTFPENYGSAELAGKEAVFECHIHEIHEKVDSKINDDLAKKLGMDDLEALKKILREQMQGEYAQFTRMKLKRDLLDQLDAGHKFELPSMMLDQEYEMIIKQMEQERHQQNHADGEKKDCCDDDGCHAELLSKEEQDEMREIAERRVKLGLVLSEIGSTNKITVEQADLQKAVMAEAQKYPGQEAQVFEFYQKNKNALDSLRAPIFEEKVVDYIIELADVTEKKVSLEELTADEDEVPAKPKKKAATKKAPAKKKAETKK